MKSLTALDWKLFFALGDKTLMLFFIGGMVLLFLLFVLLLARRTYVVSRSIKVICKFFTTQAIRNNPVLRSQWESYSTTFIHDIHKNYRTTHDAALFFNNETILPKALRLRWWMFAPNIFFFLGLCTLVLQIVYAFVAFDIGSQESILESVKIGFLAVCNGLIGLLAGIFLTLTGFAFVRAMVARLQTRLRVLANKLNSLFKISTLEERQLTLQFFEKSLHDTFLRLLQGEGTDAVPPARVSRELLGALRVQTSYLEQIAKNLAARKPQEEVVDRLAQRIGETVSTALRKNLEELHASLQTLQHHADSPEQQLSHQDITRLLTGIHQLLAKANDNLTSTLQSQLDRFSTALIDHNNRIPQ